MRSVFRCKHSAWGVPGRWAGVLTVFIAWAAAAEFKPFAVPEDQVKVTLYVDGGNARASDDNPGTAARPFKTIGRAASVALTNKMQEIGTRVVIAPGVYRESVRIELPGYASDTAPGSKDGNAPLVIEARKPGTVVLEGADEWTDCSTTDGGKTYTHAWTNGWGSLANPWAKQEVYVPSVLGRRELVLASGSPLRQVLDPTDLEPGTFGVSEEEKRLTLCLPAGQTIRRTRIEVGVRAEMLMISGLNNVVVRGLTFRHAANRFFIWSAGVSKCKGAVVEDCVWEWNNWYGFQIYACDDVVMRRCVARNNGGGNGVGFCRNLLLEDVETSSNNWRGAAVDWYGWESAGIKVMYTHRARFTRHRAADNRCAGLLLDSDNEDFVLDRCTWIGNIWGMVLQGSQGPLLLTNCVAAYNEIGLSLETSGNGGIVGCTLYDNRCGQLVVQGPQTAYFRNFETGRELAPQVQNWILRDNMIVSTDGSGVWSREPTESFLPHVRAPLVSVPAWDYFRNTFKASGNLYYHPMPEACFQYGSLNMRKEPMAGLSLNEWRAVTKQDLDSLMAEPRLRNPAKGDFTPLPDSPVFKRAEWPKASLSEIQMTLRPELRRYLRLP